MRENISMHETMRPWTDERERNRKGSGRKRLERIHNQPDSSDSLLAEDIRFQIERRNDFDRS